MLNNQTIQVEVQQKEPSYEAFISTGMELRERSDNINWSLGDLAIEFERVYGDKALAGFANEIGVNQNTLRRCRDVSKAYNPFEREEFKVLSWSHFKEVAKRDNRMKVLKLAADSSWSVHKLHELTKDGEIKPDLNLPPKPEMSWDEIYKAWYISDLNKDARYLREKRPYND